MVMIMFLCSSMRLGARSPGRLGRSFLSCLRYILPFHILLLKNLLFGQELEEAGGPVDLLTNIDILQGRWKLIYSSAFSSRTLGGSRPEPKRPFGQTNCRDRRSVVNSSKFHTLFLQGFENFSHANKIGQGGFGSVFKAKLKDGTVAAVKVLSAESQQGVKEFLNEINVIANIEHKNLVKLHGCCVEDNHRILVYGYLENNSLAQSFFGRGLSSIQIGWQARHRICIDVAQGLSFLHEEVTPHIIHRDIKASNVLLDKDLRAKISDFGLAKLIPPHLTHISTGVAGTVGYVAPEYAIRGQVTRKSDIYSFGVLLLEIVSGRSNTNRRLPAKDQYLLVRAWTQYENGKLEELVDSLLNDDLDLEEACKFMKIALLCTQDMPKLRPAMSTVVAMLTGEMTWKELEISKPGLLTEFISKKGEKDLIFTGSADKTPSSTSNDTSIATMTFNSIYDRSH